MIPLRGDDYYACKIGLRVVALVDSDQHGNQVSASLPPHRIVPEASELRQQVNVKTADSGALWLPAEWLFCPTLRTSEHMFLHPTALSLAAHGQLIAALCAAT